MRRKDCLLRPIGEADLEMVLEWRNTDRVRFNMFNEHVISKEEHWTWFANLQTRQDAQCMIFEVERTPYGVINISRIDTTNNRCHWGFYLGTAQAPPGAAAAMGFCAMEYIFDSLRAHKLVGEVLAFNEASIGYHRKLGFVQEGCFVQHILKRDRYEDVLVFALFKQDWDNIKDNLMRSCFNSEDNR